MNCRNEKDVDTYAFGTENYNLDLVVLEIKHLKFTDRSFHSDSISKSFVMAFKYQKKRVETHVRSEITPPVITNRMLEKEPDHAWEFLAEHFNTVRDNNGLPLSSWCRASLKLIPTVSKADYSN